MIGTFLSVIDKLISLAKEREKNNELVFTRIIEPLYEEFEKIATQYFSLFRTTLDNLNTGEIDQSVLDTIKIQRNEYIQARLKLLSLLDSFGFSPDTENLCVSIKEFFFINETVLRIPGELPDEISNGPLRSRGEQMIDTIHDYWRQRTNDPLPVESVSKSEITNYLKDAISSMELSWSESSKIYGDLKVKLLTPMKM